MLLVLALYETFGKEMYNVSSVFTILKQGVSYLKSFLANVNAGNGMSLDMLGRGSGSRLEPLLEGAF